MNKESKDNNEYIDFDKLYEVFHPHSKKLADQI